MKLLGLNSTEIFIILVVLLSILGPKRIENGFLLFKKLLKFLLIKDENITLENSKLKVEEPEEDQVKALEVAVQFSGMIGGGIDKIQKTFAPAIQQQLAEDGISMPKFMPHKYTGQLHSLKEGEPKIKHKRMLEGEANGK